MQAEMSNAAKPIFWVGVKGASNLNMIKEMTMVGITHVIIGSTYFIFTGQILMNCKCR